MQQCVCCMLVHISVSTWGSQRKVTNFLELESQMVVGCMDARKSSAPMQEWYTLSTLLLARDYEWQQNTTKDPLHDVSGLVLADLAISCTFTEVLDLNTQLMGFCCRKRPDQTRCRFIWHCSITGSLVPKNGASEVLCLGLSWKVL